MEERKIPVILDLDTGVDDAMALALAAASDRLEILGLTAVYGNRPADETASNTLRVAEQLGLEVPVARGASRACWIPPSTTPCSRWWTSTAQTAWATAPA